MNSVNYEVGECGLRPWGRWEVLACGEGYILKEIQVEKDQVLSLQRHKHRSEYWTIIEGEGEVTLGDKLITLSEGDSIFIPQGMIHRIRSLGVGTLRFVELQKGKILDEQDIERLEDSYGRTN